MTEYIKELAEFEEKLDFDKEYKSYNEVLSDICDLGNLILYDLSVVSILEPTETSVKNHQELFIGLITRISKIFRAILLLFEKDYHTGIMILSRVLADNIITYKYLYEKLDDKMFHKIVKSSLSYEKIRFNELKNFNDPFAKQLKSRIREKFNNYDFNMKDIDVKKDKKAYPSIFEMCKTVGMKDFYTLFYGQISAFLHGSLFSIIDYDLEKHDNFFHPNISDKVSGSPYLFMLTYNNILEICLLHLNKFQPNRDVEEVIRKHIRIKDKILKASDAFHVNQG